MIDCILTPNGSQIADERFSMGEELCRLDNVRMKTCFITYPEAFSHNLANLRPPEILFIHELNTKKLAY